MRGSSTPTLSKSLRALARAAKTEDGIPEACLLDAADRIDVLMSKITNPIPEHCVYYSHRTCRDYAPTRPVDWCLHCLTAGDDL
jgi:hypothetical protein